MEGLEQATNDTFFLNLKHVFLVRGMNIFLTASIKLLNENFASWLELTYVNWVIVRSCRYYLSYC